MADVDQAGVGFASDSDVPIAYMQRTRDYYLALGYANPYRWAHYVEAPFSRLARPLAESRIALVVTAAPFQPGKGDQGPGAPYNSAVKFYEVYSGRSDEDHDLRIAHVAYDRAHTSAADPNTYCPLPLLRRLAAEGRIGSLAPRFHGVPTNRSQRTTLEVDAPEVLARCREDGAQAVVLVPNCPVCHQTVSLTARHLEAHGIATVVMGCAKDIVEHAAAPRFLFSDFPLGNAAGKPHDAASQRDTLELALTLLEAAPAPRITLPSPQRWSDDPAWKADYMNVAAIPEEEIRRRRAENDRQKEIARRLRQDLATARG